MLPYYGMKTWSESKEYLSEIPCLVTGLPASGVTPMKNSAYNGGVQDSFWIIPWEVCELQEVVFKVCLVRRRSSVGRATES